MNEYASEFWSETEEYHDLVEEYERNVELDHPNFTTTDRLFRWSNKCSYTATAIKYPSYHGPKLWQQV